MNATLTAHCPDIECEGCARSIHRVLSRLSGVQGVDVDIADKQVAVRYDDAQTTEAAVRERLEQAGFPVA